MKMIISTVLFSILLNPILGQFDGGVRPDVTFGEHNDRFDIGDMKETRVQYESAEGEEFRRQMENQAKILEDAGALQLSATNNMAKSLEQTFVDTPKVEEIEFSFDPGKANTGVEGNFEQDFKIFKTNAKEMEEEQKRKDKDARRSGKEILEYLHNRKRSYRRMNANINTDAEILLHYAVPVVLQIQGYIQTPLEE